MAAGLWISTCWNKTLTKAAPYTILEGVWGRLYNGQRGTVDIPARLC